AQSISVRIGRTLQQRQHRYEIGMAARGILKMDRTTGSRRTIARHIWIGRIFRTGIGWSATTATAAAAITAAATTTSSSARSRRSRKLRLQGLVIIGGSPWAAAGACL